MFLLDKPYAISMARLENVAAVAKWALFGEGKYRVSHNATSLIRKAFLALAPPFLADSIANQDLVFMLAAITGPYTSLGGCEAQGFISTKYQNASEDWPDIEYHFTSGTPGSDGGHQVRRMHGLNERVS